jgi:hypothetical protein
LYHAKSKFCKGVESKLQKGLVLVRAAVAALFFLLAQPIREAKLPEQPTASEIEELRTGGPWPEQAGADPQILIYPATAAPIESAKAQAGLRAEVPPAEPDPNYLDYLKEHGGTQV